MKLGEKSDYYRPVYNHIKKAHVWEFCSWHIVRHTSVRWGDLDVVRNLDWEFCFKRDDIENI